MPHLDLSFQSAKDRMKPQALYSDKKSHILNPTVFSLIQSRVRQQMTFTADPHGDSLYVVIISSELNWRVSLFNSKSHKTQKQLAADDFICHGLTCQSPVLLLEGG